MQLLFEQKKPGRVHSSIEPVPISISGTPTTVGALIESIVRVCVSAYNASVAKHAADSADPDLEGSSTVESVSTMSVEEIQQLADTGRIAFGVVYSERTADMVEAIANALQSYDDGLYRLFLDGQPLGERASDPVELQEGSRITIIRMTLLAGRMW